MLIVVAPSRLFIFKASAIGRRQSIRRGHCEFLKLSFRHRTPKSTDAQGFHMLAAVQYEDKKKQPGTAGLFREFLFRLVYFVSLAI